MTVSELLSWAQRELAPSPDGHADSRIMLCRVLGVGHPSLISKARDDIHPQSVEEFKSLVAKRKAGYPIAYLIHSREFWSLNLHIDENVLIPRHETELVVERCLDLAGGNSGADILELGTGSGAISLALAYELHDARILATDVSADALAVAERNRLALGLSNIEYLESCWFGAVESVKFDLICANPPYVAAGDAHLQTGDLRFEPLSALVAGDNGCQALFHIIDNAGGYLKPGGWLCLEHGCQQASEVASRFRNAGFSLLRTHRDLNGHDRVTEGCLQN